MCATEVSPTREFSDRSGHAALKLQTSQDLRLVTTHKPPERQAPLLGGKKQAAL
jgi:hypothetical protein